MYENLGLAFLAAYLRNQGHSVEIVDGYAWNLDDSTIVERVAKSAPDLIGLHCTYQSAGNAKVVANLLRARLPDAHITIGGEHATFVPSEFLSGGTAFDSVVRGEGEETLCELVNAIASGDDLCKIRGVHYRSREGVVGNLDRTAISNIDELPFAARDTLSEALGLGMPILVGMLASRGCYSTCSFCNANRFFRLGGGKVVRRRSPRNVADEMEYIYKNFVGELVARGGDTRLFFYDATFITRDRPSKQWAEELAHELIDRKVKIPFKAFLRADSLASSDASLIALLKRAGFQSAFVGFESATDSILAIYDKGVSRGQNIEAARLLEEHGILDVTNGFIMFGPYSTLSDVIQNAEFLLHTRQCTLWNLTQRLQIFPGLPMFNRLEEQGLLLQWDGNVYPYRYRSRAVAKLVERLGWNEAEVVQRENRLVRYVKEKLAVFERHATSESISGAQRGVAGRLDSINRANYEFFVQQVTRLDGLTDAECAQSIFRHFERLKEQLDDLSERFKKLLKIMSACL